MKRILSIIAALLLLAAPVGADYLEEADRAADGEASAALREYVYQSGAARDVKAEQRRLMIYRYMLDLKKQQWDYSQRIRAETYELSGKRPELDHHAELAYEYSKVSASLQEEISRNEAYLKKITDDSSVTAKADELAAALPKEKSPIGRYIADVAAALAALALTAALLRRRVRTAVKMSQRKRDCLRMLRSGRYVIAAAAIICATAAGVGSVEYNRWDKGYAIDPLPESTGEYLTDVEALDEYVYSRIQNGIDGFENVWKYDIAMAYADILNDRVAKDMDTLVKTYEVRAAAARTEAERLGSAAWQAYNSAETGPDARYGERMDDYINLSIDAGYNVFEAEYCENIIFLMTKDSVIPEPGAEERVKADIAAIYEHIGEIAHSAANPEPPFYELYALIGLLVGAVFSAAVLLIIGRIRLDLRLRGQKMATEKSEHGRLMDDINFRG